MRILDFKLSLEVSNRLVVLNERGDTITTDVVIHSNKLFEKRGTIIVKLAYDVPVIRIAIVRKKSEDNWIIKRFHQKLLNKHIREFLLKEILDKDEWGYKFSRNCDKYAGYTTQTAFYKQYYQVNVMRLSDYFEFSKLDDMPILITDPTASWKVFRWRTNAKWVFYEHEPVFKGQRGEGLMYKPIMYGGSHYSDRMTCESYCNSVLVRYLITHTEHYKYLLDNVALFRVCTHPMYYDDPYYKLNGYTNLFSMLKTSDTLYSERTDELDNVWSLMTSDSDSNRQLGLELYQSGAWKTT
jgi:hypothetical protein